MPDGPADDANLTCSTSSVSRPSPISATLLIGTLVTDRPATQDLLALPRSRYTQEPSANTNSPCLRETEVWLATMSQPGPRPTLQTRFG